MNKVKVIEQGKTISIKDLPDCEHKIAMLSIVKYPDAKICVIAMPVIMPVIKSNKDQKLADDFPWQCKAGWPSYADSRQSILTNHQYIQCICCHDRDGVMDYGEILPYNVAIILFPEWKDREYIEPAFNMGGDNG